MPLGYVFAKFVVMAFGVVQLKLKTLLLCSPPQVLDPLSQKNLNHIKE
jgi:hypothetical protein